MMTNVEISFLINALDRANCSICCFEQIELDIEEKQDGYAVMVSIEYATISKGKHYDDEHGNLLFN